MNMQNTQCQRCGASVPVPADLSVLSMRCTYCGNEQPVPNFVERQRAAQQHQFQAQQQQQIMAHMQSAQQAGRSMQKMIFLFVGVILLVSLGFTAFTMARSMGVFGD